MQLSTYLRTVLKIDSASCLAMAAILIPAAAMLEGPTGIAAAMLRASGIALIPLGAFILWLGTRREAPAGLVWLVIVGNIGWTAASLAAASSLPQITPAGYFLVIGQGLAVLLLAYLEWRGLRSSQLIQGAGA